MIKTPAALSNAALRKLFVAQIPADFADWLDFVAIGALLAFTWNAEPVVFAVLALSMGLPYLVIGPVAGVLVDRMSYKTVMIWANLGRAIVTASFFFAPNWFILMVLVASRSAVDSFFTPSKQAAIQALTTPSDRVGANGLSHAINQSSKIVAPAIGGGLLIWLEPQLVFLLNAVMSLLAAALLFRLANPAQKERALDNAKTGMVRDIKSGLQEVASHKILRTTILMMAAGYFAMFFYDTLIAPLTRDLGFTQTVLGLAFAAVGAGGVIGAFGMGFVQKMQHPFLWIGAGALISGIAVIFLGAMEIFNADISIVIFVSVFGILGISSALAVVPFRTVIQNTVSENRIGRVTALVESANMMALLVAPFVGAMIASATSIGGAFICGGALMLLISAKAILLRNLR